MNTAKYVASMIEQWKASGAEAWRIVWSVALLCVDWPYVFGAWGAECTPGERKKRKRDDHQTIVSKCQVLNGSKDSCAGCKWLPGGERVRCFDCRGFTDWCLKQVGIDLQGEGATSQWNNGSNWLRKGEIATMPENTLVCLFVKKGSKMEHTGFGMNNETCECSAGVQHFTRRNGKWTHWAIPRGLYDGGDGATERYGVATEREGTGTERDGVATEREGTGTERDGVATEREGTVLSVPAEHVTEKTVPCVPDTASATSADKPTLRRGNIGDKVKQLQQELNRRGYDCGSTGADGIFGKNTEAALKRFQQDHGLAADGICGPLTNAALEKKEQPTVLYSVTVPHMTQYQAEALVAQYTGAWMSKE